MEVLSVIRLLVRRRRLVVVGALLAVLCSVTAMAKLGSGTRSRAWQVGTQQQVDTPKPLVADSDANAATVQTQTVLLADYLTSEASQAEMARLAGIPRDQLTVYTPSIDVAGRQSPLVTAAQVTNEPTTPYAVSATAWTYTPLISLAASGPDGRIVARLSESASRVLSGGQSAGSAKMVVRQLGPAEVTATTASRPGKVLAVAVGLFVFGGWCFALVLATGLARLWRGTAREHAPAAAG